MTNASLRLRLVLALVVITTVTSTLFAGGVFLIKQQLEEVIFGEMVHDQLAIFSRQLDDGTYNDESLFNNWKLYRDENSPELHDNIRALEVGSHHSIRIDKAYYQVEVGQRQGNKIYLTYDITEWENLEHQLLEMLAYGIAIVMLAAIFMGRQASKAVLAPVNALAEEVSSMRLKQRKIRLADDYQGSEISLIATAFDQFMERLDQFVDRERSFTAAASHELRTPLSVMMGAVDVLDTQEQSSASKRALTRIKRACGEMQAFIEATLFLSREDSGTIYQGVSSNVNSIIQSLIEDNNQTITEKNIVVSHQRNADFSFSQPDSIIHIMLGNILRNAIEHTKNGEIEVTVSRNQIVISDSGTGIPKTDLPHVFERSYTTKEGGTGLGLNLVKRICDRFDWSLEIRSEINRGTKVVIFINHALDAKY